MHRRWLPSALSIMGAVLGVVLLGEVSLIATRGTVTPDAAVTIASAVPFVALLGGAGYWLPRSSLSPDRYPRVGGWVLVATVFTAAIFGVIAFVTQRNWVVRVSIIQWALSVGGGAGLLIGTFEGRAIERTVVAERVRIRNEELSRQNERLDEVASVIAHDLRNPLNVAEGYVDLAREDYDDERLDGAATAIDRMEQIVADTLELARSGRMVEDMEPVDLATLVEECWANVDTADATLAPDVTASVVADRTRLKHLFENLLRNAVVHGGSDVTVTIGDLSDGFYVADDGVGIPEDEREDVFDASYTTAAEGNGFGLAIVRQIVEAHGWQIDLVESEDGGSRFEITGVETAPTPLATFPGAARIVGF